MGESKEISLQFKKMIASIKKGHIAYFAQFTDSLASFSLAQKRYIAEEFQTRLKDIKPNLYFYLQGVIELLGLSGRVDYQKAGELFSAALKLREDFAYSNLGQLVKENQYRPSDALLDALRIPLVKDPLQLAGLIYRIGAAFGSAMAAVDFAVMIANGQYIANSEDFDALNLHYPGPNPIAQTVALYRMPMSRQVGVAFSNRGLLASENGYLLSEADCEAAGIINPGVDDPTLHAALLFIQGIRFESDAAIYNFAFLLDEGANLSNEVLEAAFEAARITYPGENRDRQLGLLYLRAMAFGVPMASQRLLEMMKAEKYLPTLTDLKEVEIEADNEQISNFFLSLVISKVPKVFLHLANMVLAGYNLPSKIFQAMGIEEPVSNPAQKASILCLGAMVLKVPSSESQLFELIKSTDYFPDISDFRRVGFSREEILRMYSKALSLKIPTVIHGIAVQVANGHRLLTQAEFKALGIPLISDDLNAQAAILYAYVAREYPLSFSNLGVLIHEEKYLGSTALFSMMKLPMTKGRIQQVAVLYFEAMKQNVDVAYYNMGILIEEDSYLPTVEECQVVNVVHPGGKDSRKIAAAFYREAMKYRLAKAYYAKASLIEGGVYPLHFEDIKAAGIKNPNDPRVLKKSLIFTQFSLIAALLGDDTAMTKLTAPDSRLPNFHLQVTHCIHVALEYEQFEDRCEFLMVYVALYALYKYLHEKMKAGNGNDQAQKLRQVDFTKLIQQVFHKEITSLAELKTHLDEASNLRRTISQPLRSISFGSLTSLNRTQEYYDLRNNLIRVTTNFDYLEKAVICFQEFLQFMSPQSDSFESLLLRRYSESLSSPQEQKSSLLFSPSKQ